MMKYYISTQNPSPSTCHSPFCAINIMFRVIAGKQLHRRWKSLRDCYGRELQKQKSERSGSAASSRKQYIYFEQLRFLEPVCCPTETNIEDDGGGVMVDQLDEQDHRESEYIVDHPPLPPAKRSRKKKNDDDELIQVLKQKVAQQGNESFPAGDHDALFMMSLVPEIKKVPENQRLLLKTQFMNTTIRAQEMNPFIS